MLFQFLLSGLVWFGFLLWVLGLLFLEECHVQVFRFLGSGMLELLFGFMSGLGAHAVLIGKFKFFNLKIILEKNLTKI